MLRLLLILLCGFGLYAGVAEVPVLSTAAAKDTGTNRTISEFVKSLEIKRLHVLSAYKNKEYAPEDPGQNYREAVRSLEKLVHETAKDNEKARLFIHAALFEDIGYIYYNEGLYKKAEHILLRAAGNYSEAGAKNRLAATYISLGKTYERSGLYAKASQYYAMAKDELENRESIHFQEASVKFEKLSMIRAAISPGGEGSASVFSEEEPERYEDIDFLTRFELSVMHQRALKAFEQKNIESAANLIEMLIRRYEELTADENPALAKLYTKLGIIEFLSFNNNKALQHYQKALEIRSQTSEPHDRAIGFLQKEIARIYAQKGMKGAASEILQSAITRFEDFYGYNDMQTQEMRSLYAYVKQDHALKNN